MEYIKKKSERLKNLNLYNPNIFISASVGVKLPFAMFLLITSTGVADMALGNMLWLHL